MVEIKKESEVSVVPESWRDINPISGYYITDYSTIGTISNVNNALDNKNIFATVPQARVSLAMSQLSQLMKAAGDCDVDWGDKEKMKYCIIRYDKKIIAHDYFLYYYFLAFNTEGIRDDFMKKHKELIEQYYEL